MRGYGGEKGTMVSASNGSQTVMRSSYHFQVIPKHFAQSQKTGVQKDDEKTPEMQHSPSETEKRVRRSKRTSCQTS